MPYATPWRVPYGRVPSLGSEITNEEELESLKRLAQSMKVDLREIGDKIQQIDSKKD